VVPLQYISYEELVAAGAATNCAAAHGRTGIGRCVSFDEIVTRVPITSRLAGH
jgi:hypothetical protein